LDETVPTCTDSDIDSWAPRTHPPASGRCPARAARA